MKKYQSTNFCQSAIYALNGLYAAFKTQRNIRKHFLIALFILTLGIIFKLSLVELSILIIANTIVIVAELFNSALEFLADARFGYRYSKFCKFAKDIGAGAVLFGALVEALVAIILILPKICQI